MATPRVRAINLGRQLAAIRQAFPAATGHIRRGELVCTVPLQPTAASRIFRVRLTHRHGTPPQVHVIEPRLELHPDADALPHAYPGDRLCLYYHSEWDDSRLLASTVPWRPLWPRLPRNRDDGSVPNHRGAPRVLSGDGVTSPHGKL